MKITGVRTRLYEFTAGRALGDANLPTGSDRANGLAVFLDTDEGLTGCITGSPGARGAIGHHARRGCLGRPAARARAASGSGWLMPCSRAGIAAISTANVKNPLAGCDRDQIKLRRTRRDLILGHGCATLFGREAREHA